jgi:CRP-like cAMP-binding protein
MNIFFFLLLGDFFSEEGDCDDDKRGSTVKQYNTKVIEYNR